MFYCFTLARSTIYTLSYIFLPRFKRLPCINFNLDEVGRVFLFEIAIKMCEQVSYELASYELASD